MTLRRRLATGALCAALLVVGGCGGDGGNDARDTDTRPTADTVPPPAPTGTGETTGSGVNAPTNGTTETSP